MFNYRDLHKELYDEILSTGKFSTGDGEVIDFKAATPKEIEDGIARRERLYRKGVRQKAWGFRNEAEFEEAVFQFLSEQGYECQRQVQCGVGVIDVLTSWAVFELKYDMDRDGLFRAVGQVLLYARSIGDNRFPIIVFTARTNITWGGALEHATELGIMLWQWPGAVYDKGGNE